MNNKKVIIASVIVFAALYFFAFYLAIAEAQKDTFLKKQIGQMLIVGFRGTEAGDKSNIVKAIKDLNLGGVILFDLDGPTKSFPRNILNAPQLRKLIRDLKKYSPEPLFVAVDAEGGRVNRLKVEYDFMNFPSPEILGKRNDLNLTRKVSSELAGQLFDLGFNVNFAPSVDVNVNPANPVIGALGRSFSSDPDRVAAQAGAFIEGQHKYGIITAIKHFPGHGSSKADSHKGLVDVSETYQPEELSPYRVLINDGTVDMIMTAHIMNKKIDPDHPATLSGRYIQDILRKELGFQGIVVSDDMHMRAITEHYGFKEAMIRAVNAGCDLLIISNNGSVYDERAAYRARAILYKAVKCHQIPLSRILESYDRIRKLKERLKK